MSARFILSAPSRNGRRSGFKNRAESGEMRGQRKQPLQAIRVSPRRAALTMPWGNRGAITQPDQGAGTEETELTFS